MRVVLAFLLAALSAVPAAAAERTFVFSPADLASMVDQFNASVIADSAAFGGQVGIRGNTVRFFGRSCQSLSGDDGSAASRVRVLDGSGTAALLAGRRPNSAFGSALRSMGTAAWILPATARTRQPSWVVESAAPSVVGFATVGFASGDPTGAIGAAASGNTTPSFLVSVDLTNVAYEPAALVFALTTERPPSRPGKMPRRSECILVGSAYPADVQALVDLLAATPLADTTHVRLQNILDAALARLQQGRTKSAARAVKQFALEIARRSGAEIPPDAAEKMVTRGLVVSDALGL
jgi:hypothetical protein